MKTQKKPSDSTPAEIQEREYAFPYHYIPSALNEGFSQTRHFSWGFRYLGGLSVVAEEVARLEPTSLIDIGCGDGTFADVLSKYGEKRTDNK